MPRIRDMPPYYVVHDGSCHVSVRESPRGAVDELFNMDSQAYRGGPTSRDIEYVVYDMKDGDDADVGMMGKPELVDTLGKTRAAIHRERRATVYPPCIVCRKPCINNLLDVNLHKKCA